MLRYTPQDHGDFAKIPIHLKRIQATLDIINSSIQQGQLEQIRRVAMIEDSIDHMDEVFFLQNICQWLFTLVVFVASRPEVY